MADSPALVSPVDQAIVHRDRCEVLRWLSRLGEAVARGLRAVVLWENFENFADTIPTSMIPKIVFLTPPEGLAAQQLLQKNTIVISIRIVYLQTIETGLGLGVGGSI
jgi:hypothetical protein